MSRASLEDCQEKLKRYNENLAKFNFHKEEYTTYKKSCDEKIAELNTNQLPALKRKQSEYQTVSDLIRSILSGIDVAAAIAASKRINDINKRISEINRRIATIMQMLDGQAQPGEVHNLFAEGQMLAEERDQLKQEHASLVPLVTQYNAILKQIAPHQAEQQKINTEIQTLKTEIDEIEKEALLDRNHYDVHATKINHYRDILKGIQAEWDEFKCSEHGLSLPPYEEIPLGDNEEVPEPEEEEQEELDIPEEELDEPEEYEEGEEWDLEEDDYLPEDDEYPENR